MPRRGLRVNVAVVGGGGGGAVAPMMLSEDPTWLWHLKTQSG